tara:strand:- start:113 stop:565 length:453 start_codon:yes stop_codon:yes gene_type:complete
MTSNIGTKKISSSQIGFKDSNKSKNKTSTPFDDIKKYFLPEFLNRIDDIVLFNSLTKEDLFKIIDLQLVDLKNNLAERNNSLRISQTAKDYLLRDGAHREWGARPLRRLIQNDIENTVSNKFIEGKFKDNCLISIKAKKNKLVFTQFKKK